jgi:hypothetical protein
MSPFQATKHPTPHVGARSKRVAGHTLICVGILAFALTLEPTRAYGESPMGEFIAVTRPSSGVVASQPLAVQQTVFEDGVSSKIQPHTSGPLTARSARNLFSGFAVALERVREIPSCGALFETFTASGVEKMAHTFYVAPNVVEDREFCVGGVTAFTQVGSRVTRLCPAFGDVDRQTAALLLIHEALHSAGMREYPSTAGALTPSEINRLVKTACDL